METFTFEVQEVVIMFIKSVEAEEVVVADVEAPELKIKDVGEIQSQAQGALWRCAAGEVGIC